MLRSALPEGERVLTGWDAILSHLCDTLRLRGLNGQRFTVPQLRRLQRRYGLPVLRGGALIRVRRGHQRTLPTSTNFLLTSWALSRPYVGELFTVSYPPRAAASIARVGAENGPGTVKLEPAPGELTALPH